MAFVATNPPTTTTTPVPSHFDPEADTELDTNAWCARAHEMSMMSMMEGTLVSKEKALPAVLQWLASIYEVHKGQATPKREVYADYLTFCRTNCIEPTNAPAFGKILRMVFPDITSRRLGRRGHTSHHYNHFRRRAVAGAPTPIKTEAGTTPYNGYESHDALAHSAPVPLSHMPQMSNGMNKHVLVDNNMNDGMNGQYMNGGARYTNPTMPDSSQGYQPQFSDPSQNQQEPGMYAQQAYWHQQQMQALQHQQLTLSASLQHSNTQPFAVSAQNLMGHPTTMISPHMLTSSSLPSTSAHNAGPMPVTMPPAPHLPMNATAVPNMSNPLPATVPTVLPSSSPALQSNTESSLFKSLLSSPDFSIEASDTLTTLLTDFDPRMWRSDIPMVISPESTARSVSTMLGNILDANLPQPTEPGKVPLFTIDSQQLPLEELKQDARRFTTLYRNHYQTLLDSLTSNDFETVYTSLFLFWPQAKAFHGLLSSQPVIEQILNIDAMMYSSILGLILPSLFAEVHAEQLDRIYVFSRSFTGWLRDAMAFNIPYGIYEYKLKVADSFCRGLFTRASLNRLSQILRMHLNHEHAKPSSMLADWEKIDFDYIDGQTWLYGEFRKIPMTIKDDMPKYLARGQVEDWSQWVRDVCENVMKGVYAPLTLSVPEFLLKWSIYTNLITSYLTLQRATSLDGYLALFTWMDAMFTHVLEEQEQQRVRRVRAANSRSSMSASFAPSGSFLRRNSLPGTASFSTPAGVPSVGSSLIPNILSTGDEDEFSGF